MGCQGGCEPGEHDLSELDSLARRLGEHDAALVFWAKGMIERLSNVSAEEIRLRAAAEAARMVQHFVVVAKDGTYSLRTELMRRGFRWDKDEREWRKPESECTKDDFAWMRSMKLRFWSDARV